MNQFLKEARKLGNIKERLEICTEEILWTGNEASKLVKTPHTKTGKVPKYIIDFFLQQEIVWNVNRRIII